MQAQKSEFLQPEFHLRIVLSSDSGMLYVWNGVLTHAALHPHRRDEEEDDALGGGDALAGEAKRAELVGVLELPVSVRRAVSVVALAPVRFSNRQARLLVLSDAGAVCLVEVR